MMYALNLDKDTGRVLSATDAELQDGSAPVVAALPDGDLSDYLYVNGEFVLSPAEPSYPVAEQNLNTDRLFEIGGRFYRAKTPIAKGEAINAWNAERVFLADILNAIETERGESA